MQNPYVLENAASRERLSDVLGRLTDEQLSHPLEAGWTVSGVLAHVAFWDLRAATLLEKWQNDEIEVSSVDVHVINEATRLLCNAIPPRAAADLVLSAAARIDHLLERLDADMLEDVKTKGKNVDLNRANHRIVHLDEIEQALL